MPRRHTMSAVPLTRRDLLRRAGTGFGMLGLAALLADEHARAAPPSPLAPRPPHFPAKAKRVVHLFMNGGPSQVDTFDPKPMLEKYVGKPIPLHMQTGRRTRAGF